VDVDVVVNVQIVCINSAMVTPVVDLAILTKTNVRLSTVHFATQFRFT
jgi:hypothetical protein